MKLWKVKALESSYITGEVMARTKDEAREKLENGDIEDRVNETPNHPDIRALSIVLDEEGI